MSKRILTTTKRDFIEQRRDGDGSIVMTNPRTNAQAVLPRDATPNELRLARQSLQEKTDTPALLDMPANKAFDQLSGAPASAEVTDPEPRRLAEGVGSPNSPYRLRQEKLWREWRERQDDKAAQEASVVERKALAAEIADALQSKPAEPTTVATADEWAARDAARDSYLNAVRDHEPFEVVQEKFAALKAFSAAPMPPTED